jgi:hypothetical protein
VVCGGQQNSPLLLVRVPEGGIGDQGCGPNQSFDIFEGTEQIQQLVICRAISGVRIK